MNEPYLLGLEMRPWNRSSLTRIGLVLACSLASVVAVGSSAQAAPWQLFSFKKIDADPNKDYPLTESNGPWLIVATTFVGETAESDAHKLVYELRKSYKLNAYMHQKTYDYTQGGMTGQGLNPDGRPKKMKYVHEEKLNEVAVLVGDFRTVDDEDGQKILKKIKTIQPDSMKSKNGHAPSQPFASLILERFAGAQPNSGPLANAFLVTNPLLPRDYFAPKGLDKLVIEMNEGVEHDLLNCKGHYSLKIGTFTGRVIIDQHEISRIEHADMIPKSWNPLKSHNEFEDKDGEDPLHVAALKAHALTEALRAKGVEAYEFHDRYSSIVTVGSFDSVGTPRADGKTEINPRIYQLMKEYGADQSGLSTQGATAGLQPKTIMVTFNGKKRPVMLDIQPVTVEIPRRSISSDYIQTSYNR